MDLTATIQYYQLVGGNVEVNVRLEYPGLTPIIRPYSFAQGDQLSPAVISQTILAEATKINALLTAGVALQAFQNQDIIAVLGLTAPDGLTAVLSNVGLTYDQVTLVVNVTFNGSTYQTVRVFMDGAALSRDALIALVSAEVARLASLPTPVTVLEQLATQGVDLIAWAQAQPVFTSDVGITFAAGVAGQFTVTTGGTPAPALTVTGTLPTGVTFVDNGDGTALLSGTTEAGTGGGYPLSITAHNGVGVDATQSFLLTING